MKILRMIPFFTTHPLVLFEKIFGIFILHKDCNVSYNCTLIKKTVYCLPLLLYMGVSKRPRRQSLIVN